MIKSAGPRYDKTCIQPVGSLSFRFLLFQATALLAYLSFFFFFSLYISGKFVLAMTRDLSLPFASTPHRYSVAPKHTHERLVVLSSLAVPLPAYARIWIFT